jgi:hypothetical protein
VIEVLLTKTKAEERLKDEALILASDAQSYLSGNTISYLEFMQVKIISYEMNVGYNEITHIARRDIRTCI